MKAIEMAMAECRTLQQDIQYPTSGLLLDFYVLLVVCWTPW